MSTSPAIAAIPTYRLTDLLFTFGIEYYTLGRQAVKHGLTFAAGQQFHHAFEYIFKSKLAETEPYDQFKRAYSHNLPRMWNGFKGKCSEDLSEFDAVVAELQKFEGIRYPEEILLHGALVTFGFGNNPGSGTLPGRQYKLAVGPIDRLVAAAFRLCSKNPVCYLPMNEDAREAVRFLNEACAEWFPGRAAKLLPAPSEATTTN